MVMPPSRFSNEAALLARHFAGLALDASAIDFNPCLVSLHDAGAMGSITGINVQPNAVNIMNTGAMVWPQGANLQPALVSARRRIGWGRRPHLRGRRFNRFR